MVVYQLLAPTSGPMTQWPQAVSEHLQLPMVEANSANYTLSSADDNEEDIRTSHILPLISKLNFVNSSAPRRNRFLAATVALMPVIALALFLANAGMFATYALATIESRSLDARIVELDAEITAMQTGGQQPMPEYLAYLDSVIQIHQLRNLPSYETLLGELSGILNGELEVLLDGVRMTYPGDGSYRRTASLTRDAVATASGEGVLVELAGCFRGDSVSVMDTFDRISRRLGGAAYTLLDSDVSTGSEYSDFMMILERRINEN
jgi:hypothetical protein